MDIVDMALIVFIIFVVVVGVMLVDYFTCSRRLAKIIDRLDETIDMIDMITDIQAKGLDVHGERK